MTTLRISSGATLERDSHIKKYCPKDSEEPTKPELIMTIIVAQGSSFFTKLLSSDFSESCRNTLVIDNHSAEAVRAMLEFLYRADYTDSSSSSSPSSAELDDQLVFHLRVFILADQYVMPRLAAFSALKVDKLLESLIKDGHLTHALDALQIGYASTSRHDKVLRPILVKLAMSHWAALFGLEGSEENLVAMPELCADMLVARMTKDGKARKPMTDGSVLKGHRLRDGASLLNYNLRVASNASMKRKCEEDGETIHVKK